ncbi:MAG: hypothetical protein K8U03_08640 [Planctomycetia bacterium]|nr:hypothetical protein [Planctomycetia bacterium]
MTRREIAVLAYRLLAVALVAYAVAMLCPVIGSILADYGHGRFWYHVEYHDVTILTALGWLIAAAWIRVHSVKYAADTFKDDTGDVARIELNEQQLWSVGCASIGLVLTVSPLCSSLAYIVQIAQSLPHDNNEVGPDVAEFFLSHAVRLGFGLWLIFGSDSLSRFAARRLAATGRSAIVDASQDEVS